MIKNFGNGARTSLRVAIAWSVLAGTSCAGESSEENALQGIIELDERVLSFEVGGRIETLAVKRGDFVRAKTVLATLDDAIARATKEAREAEARVAASRVALLRAGTRPEDVRAMAKELEAAKANEALLEKKLARDRSLLQAGALSPALFDEIENRLAVTRASRSAIEERLRLLRSGARVEDRQIAEAQAAASEALVRLEAERVDRHQLRATHDAFVVDVLFDEDEVVPMGAPVVVLADADHPFVDVFVPQARLAGIRIGTKANLRVDGSESVFEGVVEDVSRRTEFTPRFIFSDRERPSLVVRVRVRISDPKRELHAGTPSFVELDRAAVVQTSTSGA